MNGDTNKSNVVSIAAHTDELRGVLRRTSGSRFSTHTTHGSPVDMCDVGGDKGIAAGVDPVARYHAMMADLSKHSEKQISLEDLKARWSSEWNSFNAMRYNRTGEGKKYSRDPAFDSFPSFLSVVGPKQSPEYTLDRIDPSNPHYGPGLVQWSPPNVQTHNRRNTKKLTDSQGNCFSVAEWSRRTGVPQGTIRERVRRGWPVDEAVNTAPGQRRTVPAQDQKAVTPRLLSLWREKLLTEHDQSFYSPDGKEVGQLGQIADRLAAGKVWPRKAVEYILIHWSDFTQYATTRYGAWQKPPSVPTVAFLHANVNAAGNFYLDRQHPAPTSQKAEPTFKPLPSVSSKADEQKVADQQVIDVWLDKDIEICK